MQDVQNIPAPDANPNTTEEDFDSHAHDYPDVPDEDNRRDSVRRHSASARSETRCRHRRAANG